MADFSTLIASIEATIKQNGVQAITGQVLQDELLLMVSAINQLKQDTLEGYAFYGEALPNGATRVVTQNTFFLAGAGSYTINGNAVTISDGGISVIVYDCVNDDITTYQLFAYDANPTSGSANAVTSGGVKSALDTKADKNGASPDLFAGFAGNLVDTRSAGTRQGPFAFRQSGGDGVNYMRKILGRTEAFNQLVENGNFATASEWGSSNASLTFDTNCAKMTASAKYGGIRTLNRLDVIAGHTYLISFDISTSVEYGHLRADWGSITIEVIGTDTGRRRGVVTSTASSSGSEFFWIHDYNDSNFQEVTIYNAFVVDLTLEGLGLTTAAAFQSLHPLPYYNYNAGVLKNNAATGLETTGFNQWDEEWEKGIINSQTGEDGYSDTNSRSKNYIPVIEGQTYYFKAPYSLYTRLYNKNKEYLGQGDTVANNEYLIPAGVAFIRFVTDYAYISIGDICINLSDASRNGIYEPYWKRNIVLGLNNLACHDENNNAVVVNGLDGVGTAQDELVVENGWGTKIIKRRGRRAYQAGDESDATLMTDGTNTDYPLATPKVLTLDNPIPALIEVDNLGTEKRLPEDTADNPQAPFECDSNYSISTVNLVRKLNE